MTGEVLTPTPARKSEYGVDPKYLGMRGSELEGITSVKIENLFNDMPQSIYSIGKTTKKVRKATEEALNDVDMSMIKKGDSVNVLSSHHGFTILDGRPFAEFLRAIRDVIEDKTGTDKIRLRVGCGLRFREPLEYIKEFELDDYYSSAREIAPIDAPVEINTEIGKLYGLKQAYAADWIVHAHNSDLREVHFHRQVDRAFKPFAMSYARSETRSTYHFNLGPRAANFAARAIFDSDFVQSKYTFSAFMLASPSGVWGAEADNDLESLNEKVTVSNLKTYGKVLTLLGELKDVIPILDCPTPVPYVFSGGLIYANFVGANMDMFDLKETSIPPYTWYTEVYYDENGEPMIDEVVPPNPEIKTTIHNYAWGGYPSEWFAEQIPTILVGEEQAKVMNEDPQNRNYMNYAEVSQSLENAVESAEESTGIDKLLLFDGAQGGFNVSKSLSGEIESKATEVDEKVMQELMPKWLRQRGINPEEVKI